MRISVLSRRTGVSTYRLRRYDALGLIRAQRSSRGYRDYDDAVVREVTFVAMGRDLGFSLAEIGALLPSYRAGTLSIDEMVARLRTRIDEIDAEIREHEARRSQLLEHIAWFEQRRTRAARGPEEPVLDHIRTEEAKENR